MKYAGLAELGWTEGLEADFTPYGQQGFQPARVIAEYRERYIVETINGEMPAEVTGRFEFSASCSADFPKTGDWTAAQVFEGEKKAIIHAVLPRRTCFSRKAAGLKAEEQVIAANVDLLFIVQGLDNNYNTMRLIRYITAADAAKIPPLVILNKADLNCEAEKIAAETAELVKPVRVLLVSAKTGQGMDTLKSIMKSGMTHAFAGSSGAGKSTLINAIAGREIALTSEVREDDSRGRHTTVTRQLYRLAGYGLVMDTPGMRELALWNEAGINSPGFDIISAYAEKCRYKDCCHEHEPGCAVRQAAEQGLIPAEIMESYRKLKKEAEYAATKTDFKASMEKKRKDKILGRLIKQVTGIKKAKRG